LVKDQQQYDATMLQAIRRAHRFGQTKKVHVYRFVRPLFSSADHN
jgi:hypothetical protein